MAEVTICIPAYRAEAFITQTLASVRAQTFADFVVEIAVEPDAHEPTLSACRSFLDDARFRCRVNPRVLGWDENVRGLLRRVETPYFMVLPHDDVLHPRYLELLLAALRDRADASVAYADGYLFGAASGSRSSALPIGDLGARLSAFFAGGAEGIPWRGVTRRAAITREFPTNRFRGFAVECEWTLHLLTEGVAVQVARPLYFKRQRRKGSAAVSIGWRFDMPVAMLQEALANHRLRLLAGIPRDRIDAPTLETIDLAVEAAMLRRWALFADGRFGFSPEQIACAERVIAQAPRVPSPAGGEILAMTHVALSRHWLGCGDAAEGERQARAAVAAAPESPEACAHLAWVLLSANGPVEALEYALRAGALAPQAAGAHVLMDACDRALGLLYALTPGRET